MRLDSDKLRYIARMTNLSKESCQVCEDAADEIDRLCEAVSKSAHIVAQGYWHSDQMDREDAEMFLDAAEAIGAVGMWPDD